MFDVAHNSPPKVKIPTLIIIVEKNRTPPNKKNLTHIVYKYQQAARKNEYCNGVPSVEG